MTQPKKILVVEDETHLAKGLKFNLEREGHEITVARDDYFTLAGGDVADIALESASLAL